MSQPDKHVPENQLYYPGALVLGTTFVEAGQSMEGPINAISGHLLGVTASQADVVSFYNRELSERGWTPTSLNSERSTIETAALAWQRSGVVLRLAFLMRGVDPRLPSPSVQAHYPTILRIDLIDHAGA